MIRPTVAKIDLAAVRANFRAIRDFLGGRAEIIAVVKANAYGHGAPQVALALEEAGASMLAVADIEEGMVLRSAGVRAPVLVFGALSVSVLDGIFQHRLTPTVSTPSAARALQEAAARRGVRLGYHLKIDTGMNRLGFRHDNAARTLPEVAASPNLQIEGVYTHFATADNPELPIFGEQRERFEAVADTLPSLGFLLPAHKGPAYKEEAMPDKGPTYKEEAMPDKGPAYKEEAMPDKGPAYKEEAMPARTGPAHDGHAGRGAGIPRHAANSAALLRDERVWYDYVRPGLLLYGIVPPPLAATIPLRPALSLHSRIVAVKGLRPGEGTGYGLKTIVDRPTTIAVVPAGYADGLDLRLAGRGYMLVRGQRRPIVGSICMDMTMIDVTGTDVSPGDDVVIVGEQDGESIGIREMAAAIGTIPYELLCRVGSRIQRVY